MKLDFNKNQTLKKVILLGPKLFSDSELESHFTNLGFDESGQIQQSIILALKARVTS